MELSYVLENGNPEKIPYISGNGTLLYFLKKSFSYISEKVYLIFRNRRVFGNLVYSKP